MGMRPDWPNLGVISMAYSYGFSNLVLPLLLHGIPLFLAPAPLPEILRGAAKAHWNLTVAGVPALWHAWHKAGVILNNVRLAISAGAPLPLTLEQAVLRRTRRQNPQLLRFHRMRRHRLRCDGNAADGRNLRGPAD